MKDWQSAVLGVMVLAGCTDPDEPVLEDEYSAVFTVRAIDPAAPDAATVSAMATIRDANGCDVRLADEIRVRTNGLLMNVAQAARLDDCGNESFSYAAEVPRSAEYVLVVGGRVLGTTQLD